MKKYLYLAIVEDDRVIDRVVPCEYASDDEHEIMDKVSEDERDLVVTYVKIYDRRKSHSWGKRIYAAFTEEQYKQFGAFHRVDFAGIIEGYIDIP